MGEMVGSSLLLPGAPQQQLGHVAEMTAEEHQNILTEIAEQPPFRREADEICDYYDGNQLDSEVLQEMEELGMAPVIENLMAPTIDAVLGLEAKTRLDWKVSAESDEDSSEIAEALNVKMKEAEDRSHADRACSDAFAGQTKCGLSWVEVARDHDPFGYPYRVECVHRNEVHWDMHGKKLDTTDWRWLRRARWYDADVLKTAFAAKADLIDSCARGWGDTPLEVLMDGGGQSTGLGRSFSMERGWTQLETEWRNTVRKRMCLSEIWYRRWVSGFVLRTPKGRVVEFDQSNPAHIEAIAYNMVRAERAMFTKVRLAWFVGPHKLADIPSPYKHNKFPYVPFFGKREDLTGVPYGLGRPMRTLQDEVNARNTKMIWLLAAKRITMTEGITKDKPEVVRREASRPNAMHVLDADKAMKPGALFKVETDFALNQQQYQALQDKRQAIKNVAGVYASFEGNQKGSISGIAANTLVEQSTQTLAETFDNQQFARRQVGELLLSLIIEDIGRAPHTVEIDDPINGKKTVDLNVQNNEGGLTNDVQRARLRVALSDIPSTASYREQRLMRLQELTKSLPPDLQGLVLDFVIAATDDPDRGAIVKRIRQRLGFTDPTQLTPEEKTVVDTQQQRKDALEDAAVRTQVAAATEAEARAQTAAIQADQLAIQAQQAQEALAAGGQMSPREAELQAQLQAIVEQVQQVTLRAQQEQDASRIEYERDLDELRDALTTAQMKAERQAESAETEVRKAEIAKETQIEVAKIESQRADAERSAKDRTKESEGRLSAALAALSKEVAAIRDEIKKSSEGDEGQEGPRDSEPRQINITVPVTIERGSTAKTVRLTNNEDGSFTGEVQEKTGPNQE